MLNAQGALMASAKAVIAVISSSPKVANLLSLCNEMKLLISDCHIILKAIAIDTGEQQKKT